MEAQNQSLKNDIKGKRGMEGWKAMQDAGSSSWLATELHHWLQLNS